MSRHIIDTLTAGNSVGSGITLWDRAVVLGQATHEASGPTFTDRTGEARTEGGTAFTLLGATTDKFYWGYDVKFPQLRIDLDGLGAGLTLLWEYWNGATWITLAVTDGTNGFTQDGEVSWTPPVDWAKATINTGVFFFVRVSTSTITTPPTCFFSVPNWTIYDDVAGTNAKVYKSIGENGASNILVHLNDNAPSSNNWASLRVYESWDPLTHTGVDPAPTVAQTALGSMQWKANAALRPQSIVVNRDRIVWGSDKEASGQYHSVYVGKYVSYVPGDGFAIGVFSGNTGPGDSGIFFNSTTPLAAVIGNYLQRSNTGAAKSVGAVSVGLYGGTTNHTLFPAFPNAADGSLLTCPARICESGTTIRGEYFEVLCVLHSSAAGISNGTLFTDAATGFVWYVQLQRVAATTAHCVWSAYRVS